MSFWGAWLAYAGFALLFTLIGLFLHRASRDPKTPAETRFWSISAWG